MSLGGGGGAGFAVRRPAEPAAAEHVARGGPHPVHAVGEAVLPVEGEHRRERRRHVEELGAGGDRLARGVGGLGQLDASRGVGVVGIGPADHQRVGEVGRQRLVRVPQRGDTGRDAGLDVRDLRAAAERRAERLVAGPDPERADERTRGVEGEVGRVRRQVRDLGDRRDVVGAVEDLELVARLGRRSVVPAQSDRAVLGGPVLPEVVSRQRREGPHERGLEVGRERVADGLPAPLVRVGHACADRALLGVGRQADDEAGSGADRAPDLGQQGNERPHGAADRGARGRRQHGVERGQAVARRVERLVREVVALRGQRGAVDVGPRLTRAGPVRKEGGDVRAHHLPARTDRGLVGPIGCRRHPVVQRASRGWCRARRLRRCR